MDHVGEGSARLNGGATSLVIRSSSAYALAGEPQRDTLLLGDVMLRESFSRGSRPSIMTAIQLVHKVFAVQALGERKTASVIEITTYRGDVRALLRQPITRLLARTAFVQRPRLGSEGQRETWYRRPESLLPEVTTRDQLITVDARPYRGEFVQHHDAWLIRVHLEEHLGLTVASDVPPVTDLELVEVMDLNSLTLLS